MGLKLHVKEGLRAEGLKGLKRYASSPTNWADGALIMIVLLLLPLLLLDSALSQPLAAIGMSLVFIKGAKAMRGNEKMSFLVAMLEEIIKDMSGFLLIQVASLVSFAFTFALILKSEDPSNESEGPYSDIVLALITSYSLLMHGDGFGETGLYASSSMAIFFFVIFTLLLNIVMLNALIAIMGDTYDRVSESRIEQGLLQRAQLLVELEAQMDKDNNVSAGDVGQPRG